MGLEDSTWTWQNNLVRVGFLVTFAGTFIIFVFTISVLAGSDSSAPGDVATPLILSATVAFLMVLMGIVIVREKIKRRLPKVKVLNVVIATLVIAITFGVKSLAFGVGMAFVILMCIFLLREYNSRVRGIAVCVALMCLTIAEAMRRAGGYDSGGSARHVQNVYSFFSFFLPALLVMSTLKRLPNVTAVACLGFALLSLHSAAVLCASVKDVLDDQFAGKSQAPDMYDQYSEQYCIMSTIPSPVGMLVQLFQDTVFPAYQDTSTTTTARPSIYGATTTVTTLFDCNLLHQHDDDPYGNLTNGTNDTMEFIRLDEIDTSHCYPALELITDIVDVNSTTTTATSTTSTSTTSTSSTVTTTTSTTTTSTTMTSTSTTSTSTSSTTTSTSTSTTTDNETEVTSAATLISTTTRIQMYMRTPTGQYCPSGNDIHSETECRAAASSLGLVFERAWNGAGDHKLCAFADDKRLKVFFNLAGPGAFSPYAQPLWASVCWLVTPEQEVERCSRDTEAGREEIRIRESGLWAIAIFALAGVWIAALWFVLISVGLCKSARVHPASHHDDHHHHHHDAPKPKRHDPNQLALEAPVEEEEAEGEELKAGKKKCCRRCRCCCFKCKCCKRCAKKLCGRCLPKRSRGGRSGEGGGSRCQNFCRVCKKMCKFIVKTQATMIGAAFFVATAIIIVVTGLTQLPQETPFCARKPRMPGSLLAWAEEPAQRYAVIWCEMGSQASVGLAFVAYCYFLLAFSVSLGSVRIMYNEDRLKKVKLKLKQQREHAAETGDVVESATDYGPGFRIQKMIPKEPIPKRAHEDYDGRVFDV